MQSLGYLISENTLGASLCNSPFPTRYRSQPSYEDRLCIVHFDDSTDNEPPTESYDLVLVTHGDVQGAVPVSQLVANWKNVIDQAIPLLGCLIPSIPQGNYAIH